MSRKISQCPTAPQIAVDRAGFTTTNCYIEVITPIFSGGAIKDEVDKTNSIRGSAIRGHLRFWWRATKGASYVSVSELRKKESVIWEDTECPSKVDSSL